MPHNEKSIPQSPRMSFVAQQNKKDKYTKISCDFQAGTDMLGSMVLLSPENSSALSSSMTGVVKNLTGTTVRNGALVCVNVEYST